MRSFKTFHIDSGISGRLVVERGATIAISDAAIGIDAHWGLQ